MTGEMTVILWFFAQSGHTLNVFCSRRSSLVFNFLPSAQEDGAQAKADGGDKLAAVLKLESELQAVREQAAEHESELRQELQHARRDKQQAEAKLGGLDLTQMEVCCVPHGPTIDCNCIQYNAFCCVCFTCVSLSAEEGNVDVEQRNTSQAPHTPHLKTTMLIVYPVPVVVSGRECRISNCRVAHISHPQTALLTMSPA